MKRKFIWWLGFVTLFLMFAATAFGDSWPTLNGNFQRTGSNGASIDPSTLTLDWFFTPGVGNALEPAFPGATGLPVAKGSQTAVIGFGKVVYLYVDTLIQEILVGLDASTGALLWSHVVRGAGLAFAAVQTPTIAVRDTGGPAPDTVVYIGGTNNSFRCVNANTGVLIWNKTGLSGNMRNGNLVFDTLVISSDNSNPPGGAKLTALNTRNGTLAWTSVTLGERTFSSPSISNDTVFVCTRPLGATLLGGGSIFALDANTGAILTQFDDPNERNYSNSVVVFGRALATTSRNEFSTTLGPNNGAVSSIVRFGSHDLSVAPAASGGNAFGIARFSTPNVYVESSVGETVLVYGTAIGAINSSGGEIVMRRILPTIAFRTYAPTVAGIHGPASTAAGNSVLFQGDDAGIWYVKDGNSYGAGFAGLGPYWHKVYPGFITAGTAISPDDDTLVVIMDGNGNVAGWHNGHVASRPRAQTFTQTITDGFGVDQQVPLTQVAMNIIPTDGINGTGGDATAIVPLFENSGNEDLTYELNWGSSPLALSVADLGGLGASVSLGRTHPTRGKMAQVFADDNAMTAGTGFMEKKYDFNNQSLKQMLDLEEEGISSFKEIRDMQAKTSYFGTSKLQEAKAHMTMTGWLFVNSEDGGNPSPGTRAPGDSVVLRLHAINPGGFGQYFGEVKMFNTNEPDVQGNPLDTTRISIILVIGYLGERCLLESYNGSLVKTNYSRDIAQDASDGFRIGINQVGFDGGFELGNSETTFAGLYGNLGAADPSIASPVVGWKSDSSCFLGPFYEALTDPDETLYVSSDGLDTVYVNYHFTKLAHVSGLPLNVRQYGWAMKNAVTPQAGDVFYQALVVSCTGSVGVDSVKLGAWADLDVHNFGANDFDMLNNQDAIWQYDIALPEELYGIARVPGDNINVAGTGTMWTTAHNTDGITAFPHDPADLEANWDGSFYGTFGTSPGDLSAYNGSAVFSLAPGQSKTITYMWFGVDTTAGTGTIPTQVKSRLREWLAIAGYYRGDVNLDGTVNLTDMFWVTNNVGNPSTFIAKPFRGQADVTGDGFVDGADVVLLLNYVLFFPGSGVAAGSPKDRDRFIPDAYRNVRQPGLTNDLNWLP